MKVGMDKEIATNLYAGLVAATNNFSSYSTTAETFQTAAELLKKGAVKKRPQIRGMERGGGPVENKIFSAPKPSELKSAKPLEDLEYEDEEEAMDEDDDWLKPKIFQPDQGISENKG